MRSSYKKEDVTILLKDVTGLLEPLDTFEREKKIQSGVHYSEMLPLEYKPTKEYLWLYEGALKIHGKTTAKAIQTVSEKVIKEKGKDVVLVSLARAGTPIGILMKRYIYQRYNINVPHYTISIIRGRGIDKNAMNYILKFHAPETIQFVDGWIGKGAIIKELKKEVKNYQNLNPELAVLADPAGLTSFYGTREDFLIPSSCLNATVSGLFSRTILNKTIIGENDFHGAVYFEELEKEDVSYDFIHAIENQFDFKNIILEEEKKEGTSLEDIENITKDFHIEDINFIKPGIGETTRVLLRRMPWKILVKDKKEEKYISHIKKLCEEKNIELVEYPLKCYRACGIIKSLSADI